MKFKVGDVIRYENWGNEYTLTIEQIRNGSYIGTVTYIRQGKRLSNQSYSITPLWYLVKSNQKTHLPDFL